MKNVCEDCCQGSICEMNGKPIYLSERPGDEADATAVGCFFHCCSIGAIAAVNALRQNRSSEHDLIPFGSSDKPFLNTAFIKGRYVVSKSTENGMNKGDVVVVTNSGAKKTH